MGAAVHGLMRQRRVYRGGKEGQEAVRLGSLECERFQLRKATQQGLSTTSPQIQPNTAQSTCLYLKYEPLRAVVGDRITSWS